MLVLPSHLESVYIALLNPRISVSRTMKRNPRNEKKPAGSAQQSKVAVVQAASVAFDRKRTVEKVRDLTRDAARAGARLVLFPEAFVSGYPRGLDFGAVVGSRSDKGREDFRRYWESSVDVPGPAVDALGRAARSNRVYLVIGVVERDGGTLYCTVLFFAPDGSFLGKHRKVMPTGSERLVWGFGDGSTLPVFDTPLGKLGAVICWENYLPLMRAAMYAKGIEIYCAPTADARDSWAASMRHIAIEGRCFVLSCNQFNRRRDFPDDYDAVYGHDPDTHGHARRQLHRRSVRKFSCRAQSGRRSDPNRRNRSRADRPREIRFGCRRPLRAAGHFPTPRG